MGSLVAKLSTEYVRSFSGNDDKEDATKGGWYGRGWQYGEQARKWQRVINAAEHCVILQRRDTYSITAQKTDQ